MVVMDWYDPRLYEGIMQYAIRHNWEIIGSPHLASRIPHADADGLLIVPGESPEYWRIMKLYRGHTVAMHSIPGAKVPYVVPDIAGMGGMAAEHFLKSGHQELAVLLLCTTHLLTVPKVALACATCG